MSGCALWQSVVVGGVVYYYCGVKMA
jgi:hypothetical protein